MTDSTRTVLTVPQKPAVEAQGKRAAEVSAQRRRRSDTSHEGSHKLSVNHDLLDHENFIYRFVNDKGSRIQDLTVRDDWDKVPDPDVKDDKDGLGTPIRKQVDTHKDGSPMYAYLLRKPKKFAEEDERKKSARRDELDATIKRGQHTAPAAAGADTSNSYVPDSGISMQAKVSQSDSYKP